MNWMTANDAAQWIPALNAAELRYGIPHNLLARLAFEECSFLPDIISGAEKSSADCVGIMQLNHVYYPNAGQDPVADIATGGGLLLSLYNRFNDWQVALAGYNWGGGNVHRQYVEDGAYVLANYPQETKKYVTEIVRDVPVTGSLVSV